MGIVESAEDLTESLELEMKDFDETMQDSVFPWFHIVQWSSEELPTDTVLKWNYKSIKEKVQNLTKNKQVFLSNCPISKIENFSLDEDNINCNIPFAEWAGALLSQLEDLNNIRYELVPGRMTEETFWQSYFNAIRNIIIKDVISMEKQKEKSVTCKKYKEINENEVVEENIPDFYNDGYISQLEDPNIISDHKLENSVQMDEITENKSDNQDTCANFIEDEDDKIGSYNNRMENSDQCLNDHESDVNINIGIDHDHNNDRIPSEEIPISQK